MVWHKIGCQRPRYGFCLILLTVRNLTVFIYIGLHFHYMKNYSLLHSVFSTIYTTRFCGSKAVDLCHEITDCHTVIASTLEAAQNFENIGPIFRRIVHHALRDGKNATVFCLLEKSASDDSFESDDSILNLTNTFMSSMIREEEVKCFKLLFLFIVTPRYLGGL